MRLSNPYTLEQTLSKLLKAIYTDTNAVALLEKALDKAKSDTVYAKQLEEALLKGSTIECREVFCAFGHYFQRSDTFPWYAHADAINAIDTALYYVKAGFLDADGNKREVPDLNDSVSLEISAAIAETMQDGSEEIKILPKCTLPLTCLGVINLIITDLGVLDITPKGLKLVELAPGVSKEDIQAKTGAPIDLSAVH